MNYKKTIIVFVFIFLMFKTIHPGEEPESMIILSLPGLNWCVEINSPDFALGTKEISPQGDRTYFFSTHRKKKGMVVSGFLERAKKVGTSKDCRKYFWDILKKRPVKMENIKMWESGDIAIAEYFVKEFKGKKLNQKNLNAFLVKGLFWIDIHVSKVNFSSEDYKLFESILKSVKINDSYMDQRCNVHFNILRWGVLSLNVPKAWHNEFRQKKNDPLPVIKFKDKLKPSFEVLITPIGNIKKGRDSESLKSIKDHIEKVGKKLLAQAVEKELKLKEIKKGNTAGFYYSLTDKEVKPGEYRYLVQGGIKFEDLFMMFSVLSHKMEPEIVKETVEILTGARK